MDQVSVISNLNFSFIVGSKIITVSRDKLQNSVLFCNLIQCCDVNVSLTLPSEYNSAMTYYFNFINGVTNKVKVSNKRLVLCFEFAHYIEDSTFFDFCITYLLNHWIRTFVIVEQLTDDLKQEVYLRCPYSLIPESITGYYDDDTLQYKLNTVFLDKWYHLNKNKHIHVNSTNSNSVIHKTKVEYYDNNKHHNKHHNRYHKLTCFKVDSKQLPYYISYMDGIQITWHDNNQVSDVKYFNVYKLNGYHRTWWSNGNLKQQSYYIGDKIHGINKEYYENGVQQYEMSFDHGSRIGTWKFWYPTGNLQQVISFDNDQKHGIWTCYHDHDIQQTSYEYEFDHDRECSSIKQYYIGRRKQLKSLLEFRPEMHIDDNNRFFGDYITQWDETGKQTYFGAVASNYWGAEMRRAAYGVYVHYYETDFGRDVKW